MVRRDRKTSPSASKLAFSACKYATHVDSYQRANRRYQCPVKKRDQVGISCELDKRDGHVCFCCKASERIVAWLVYLVFESSVNVD